MFYLQKDKKATLSVFDVKGRSWFELPIVGKGIHNEKINLENRSSGTFILQLKKENGIEIKKVIIIK
ncbi:T9SS type A sorting domain-containing protein [Dyadobacter sp. CY356]|uniref:T9SS type A sorting domain-containing protein n=1 Tax=Dyadobacter sp. CY356 TaxID=2906442 RepID=UPI0038D39576